MNILRAIEKIIKMAQENNGIITIITRTDKNIPVLSEYAKDIMFKDVCDAIGLGYKNLIKIEFVKGELYGIDGRIKKVIVFLCRSYL